MVGGTNGANNLKLLLFDLQSKDWPLAGPWILCSVPQGPFRHRHRLPCVRINEQEFLLNAESTLRPTGRRNAGLIC